ncbi:MAG: DUF2007 domain-containing protein [Dehalococcoidia bacterium]|nr:DUF2007 domain-containing protein [Chloroflexota bacterium]MCZ6866043.1 DUF2007 domain-containing protein [Chloroflexota bacterium]
MKWVYLTTAPDEWTAQIWRSLLLEDGIPVMLRAGDVTSFLGSSPFPTRLMVDEARKEEALDLLNEQIQPD